MAIIFDGRKFAREKEEKLRDDVVKLKKEKGLTPKIVSILVGDDPASVKYTEMKQRNAESVGIIFEKKIFPTEVKPEVIISVIQELNRDISVQGIMVQLPLPMKIQNSKLKILGSIDPGKDVDCLTPENMGLLVMGQPRFLPATVKGIMEIIGNWSASRRMEIGKLNICVVGTSNIVGKPLAVLLRDMGATVTMCGRNTNLMVSLRDADMIISATGVPSLIKKEMIKEGVAIIDAGFPKGDLDFENVSSVVSFITPVPGGVGPLTVISLMENVYLATISFS